MVEEEKEEVEVVCVGGFRTGRVDHPGSCARALCEIQSFYDQWLRQALVLQYVEGRNILRLGC